MKKNGQGEAGTTGAGRKKRPPRRMKAHLLSAEDSVENLRLLYIHLAGLCSPSVAWLARKSGVPFETLRHFLEDSKHLLCPVNEERLARALGHDARFFRALVRRFFRRQKWRTQCAAAGAVKTRLLLLWMPLLEAGRTAGAELFF